MLGYAIPALAGAIAGAVAGGLLSWLLLHRLRYGDEPASPADSWLAAEIDQAAATWATGRGQPEAAPLMADKLHLLHRLGQRRRRS